jgi:hypothetical protein
MENYQKTLASGQSISQQANDGIAATVETLTADKVLTAADSGKTFILGAEEGKAITLPALQSGLKYKFIVGLAFATSAWTVTAPVKKIQGVVIVNSTKVFGENEDIITFAHAAEKVGDWVEVICDGTNWYVNGVAEATGGITLTAS